MDILSYQLENSTQFWDELHDIASRDYHSTSNIDRALLAYLRLASLYMDQYLISDEDLTRCAYDLINSNIYCHSRAFVRRKLISMLVLGLDDLNIPWRILIGGVLLVDGRLHKSTLEMLQEEAAISLIVETLWQDRFSNVRLQRIFLELLYEMCKIQKIHTRELQKISREFIEFLFSIVENKAGYDNTDPYNMAAMKVILALNEQYMIAVLSGHDLIDDIDEDEDDLTTTTALHNKIYSILKSDGDSYRAFGENMVFIFNRGSDKCIQLMILKLFYLIFTTKETFQYMYLNDLKVVVGVIIRELDDLPPEEQDLRNTYLRVLHPLLQNTQLRYEQYKKDELVALLEVIANPTCSSSQVISENTQRLAYRCLRVDWLGYCSPVISPIVSLSEQTTGVSIDSDYVDRKQTSSVPLIEISPTTSISSSVSSSVTDLNSMPKLHHSHSFHSQPNSHSHSHSHSHSKRPPRPSPRKLQAMQIRNTSAIEVATLIKKTDTPPPPPPRHRTLNLPQTDRISRPSGNASSPTPPPPPPRRISTPVGPCP